MKFPGTLTTLLDSLKMVKKGDTKAEEGIYKIEPAAVFDFEEISAAHLLMEKGKPSVKSL
jgi:hypothetical protein